MDAAYIFGTSGNLPTALGAGWSVEDVFAWAIGAESELTLPLPGDGRAYVLRFDIHPAIYPPKVQHQRLVIRAGKTALGSFEITTRETLVIPLPVKLTSGAERLELTLIHPDATRPRDHLPVDDSRRLAVCFHSANLAQADADGPRLSSAFATGLEPVHGIIAGGGVAMRLCQVIGKLQCLKGRFGMRFLDLSQGMDKAAASLPPETLDTMQVCWMELNAGTPGARESLRFRAPAGCSVRTFHAPMIRSLWPFLGPDGRAVPEPGRYHPSRYPYGDRLAQALTGTNMPDDVLYLMYEMSAEQEPLELDEMFASDLRRWRAEGKKPNMALADFIERHISSSRVFVAPDREGPVLLREMVEQVLDDGLVRDVAGPEVVAAELDGLLEGYIGVPEQVPVHERVASHFNLAWWKPDMKYRWANNQRTHRDYILDTIRWAQWRP